MKKNTILKLLMSPMLLILIVGCATNAVVKEASVAEDFAYIKEIRLNDNTLEINSNKNFLYTMYSANDPYKITIEIPDMRVGEFTSKIVSDKAGFTEIVPRQIDSPQPSVKIDIVLQVPSSVSPVYNDNVLKLLIKPDEPVAAVVPAVVLADVKDTPEAEEPAASPAILEKRPEPPVLVSNKNSDYNEAPLAKATEITGIELKKSDDGLKVLITGNGSMMPNVFPIDQRIVVDIPGVVMKTRVPTGVSSPLKGIRAGKHTEKVRLVLDLKEKTKYDVSALGTTIEIALKGKDNVQLVSNDQPADKAQKEEPQEKPVRTEVPRPKVLKEPVKEITSLPAPEGAGDASFGGKKISLDFQEAEIGPIFRLLADVNGYNLVLDPSVKGKITIKLMNVPWDQALDIILNTFNLGKSIDGNILWVAPKTIFAKIKEEKSKEREAEEKTESLVQEILRVNYAAAGDITKAIGNAKLLSARGSITEDGRMNTLIIQDTQKSIDRIKELMKIMDISKPQVMIEAKIVEVGSTYSQTLGIKWGGSFASQTFPNTFGGNFSVNTPVSSAGPGVNVPGGAMGFTIGHANSINVELSLSALESMNQSKTLSNPKILTMDNESASIQQGRTFFIETVSQAGTQTEKQSATLSLKVTPKITPDGYIQLKVSAADNSLESVSPPVVNTKSLDTQAIVKNGETLVLGGIFTTSKTEGGSSVPVLGKIPGLGWLFKTRTVSGPDIKELLIFITPTIVGQTSS